MNKLLFNLWILTLLIVYVEIIASTPSIFLEKEGFYG